MSSIAYRHLRRQLRQAQQAQQASQQELGELREQMQQQSQTAASQLTALLQSMNTGLLVQDEHNHTTLLSPRLHDLLQLPEPPTAYRGLNCGQIFRQSRVVLDPELLIQQTKAVLQSQQRQTTLIPLVGGGMLQREYLPVVQQGRTTLHLWSFDDVTEQHRAQAREQELSRLAAQSPYPIICFGRDGRALFANPAAEPILRTLQDEQWQADWEVLRQEVELALAGNTTRVLQRHLDNHFFHWTIVPLPEQDAANIYLTDITALQQAEAELRRSQLLASRINDTIPAVVFLYDLQEKRLVYVNRQVEPLLGYTEAELLSPDLLLHSLIERQQPISAAHMMKQMAQLPEGQAIESEFRVRHRNGTWHWMRVRTTAFIKTDDGAIQQLVGSAEDITERRATEEALRQSQLLVERVMQTAPNIIYIYDLQTQRNIYHNQHVAGLLGFSEDEIQAQGFDLLLPLLPASEGQRILAHFERVAALADGQVESLEYFMYHRNGSLRWVRITNSPFERDEAGKVTQIVGICEDITRWKVADEQRRTANRRLAEQNRLFRQVIDTTPHLIYLKDSHGNYLLANRATAELYGMTPEQLVGLPIDKLPARDGDGLRYRQQDEQVLRTGQEMTREETFTRPNGELLWFHSIKRPFVLADGSVQVLGVDNNITELKNTQIDLRAAKEAAEENARAKQNFLANMSHEIRTPLNGILGMARLLSKTPLDNKQTEFLDNICQSADHLLVVINDVLVMAQLGAGKIRPESIPFDLRDALHACYDLLLTRAREKNIDLLLELPPSDVPTTVLGDPYRLKQVILNLLSNAVKFTAQGRVELACRLTGRAPDELQFYFSVLDTGPGIPPERLQEMFEPFTQVSASIAREFGGSGLGLSISRELVELMGGSLSADSEPGNGSTFSFTLPLQPAAPASVSAAPVVDYRSLGVRRVLVAEDNAVNQLLVVSLLHDWGWRVDAATTGPEALALFEEHSYDIVLMDIQMPGMDGVTATRQLRQYPDLKRAATPVVALTAHALRGEAERYAEAGFSGYLSKPFREEELFQAIAAALGGRPPVAGPPELPVPPAPAAVPLYNLSGIRRLAHGNEDFVRRLAQLFIQTTPPAIRELEQHAAAGNWQPLGEAAHSLKSTLDGLQVRQLHAVIRQLEASRKAPLDLTEAQRLVALVRNVNEQVIAGLRQDFPGL